MPTVRELIQNLGRGHSLPHSLDGLLELVQQMYTDVETLKAAGGGGALQYVNSFTVTGSDALMVPYDDTFEKYHIKFDFDPQASSMTAFCQFSTDGSTPETGSEYTFDLIEIDNAATVVGVTTGAQIDLIDEPMGNSAGQHGNILVDIEHIGDGSNFPTLFARSNSPRTTGRAVLTMVSGNRKVAEETAGLYFDFTGNVNGVAHLYGVATS